MKIVTGIILGSGLVLATGCASSRTDLLQDKSEEVVGGKLTRTIESGGSGASSSSAGATASPGPGLTPTPTPTPGITSNSAGAGSSVASHSVASNSRTISAVYSSSNCSAITRGGFIWSTDAVILADLLAPIGPANVELVLNKVNFATQGALMVDFGVMPTPDYGVKLMNDQLQHKGSKGVVQVDLVKPAVSGKRKVQAVTHPCAIYVVPRVGYSTLEVQSGLGDVFTSFSN